jgi:hypothetical protein
VNAKTLHHSLDLKMFSMSDKGVGKIYHLGSIFVDYQCVLAGSCRRKNSYPFNRLEQLITRFLSDFYSLTSHILSSLAPLEYTRLGSRGGGLNLGRLGDEEVLSRKNEATIKALEKWLESCVSGLSPTDYDSLFFEFHYLTGATQFPVYNQSNVRCSAWKDGVIVSSKCL